MTEPMQSRSRATEERILAAAERLLEEFAFEDLPVALIAETAGVSVGGIYARFDAKDALLRALHARYEAYRNEFLRASFEPSLWRAENLEARVRGICRALTVLMRERRHVLRTFLLHHWSRPHDADHLFNARLDDLYGRAVDLMLERREEIGAPDPERAAKLAMAVISGACRDIVVMKSGSMPGAVGASDLELVSTLSRAAMGVLQAAAGSGR